MTYNYNNSLLGDYLTPSGNNLIVENSIIINSGSINNTIIGYTIPSSGYFTNLRVNNTPVSLSGHSHTSSNITDFNSGVSGLLPVTNIVGGSNIIVDRSGTTFTVAVTGSLGLSTEEVDDRVSSLLVAGTGISLSYNDSANTLTINSNTFPTIANSEDNRLLTSTGSGINAESTLTFDGSILDLYAENTNGLIRTNVYSDPYLNDNVLDRGHSSIIFNSSRGSRSSPQPLQSGDVIFSIRGDGKNPNSSTDNRTIRILGQVTSSGVGRLASEVIINTSTGASGGYDNTYRFSNEGNIYINNTPVSISGHTHTSSNITNFNNSVRDVAALVPLISLGTSVSGTVPINFGSDRQAQSMTLNGGATEFTLGSGWPPPGNPSTYCIADVFLAIFPQVSTSITWSIVTQWYNRPPAGPLIGGSIHLFLLRGVAGNLFNVQGHYIGSVT